MIEFKYQQDSNKPADRYAKELVIDDKSFDDLLDRKFELLIDVRNKRDEYKKAYEVASKAVEDWNTSHSTNSTDEEYEEEKRLYGERSLLEERVDVLDDIVYNLERDY